MSSYAPTSNPTRIIIVNWAESTGGIRPSKIGYYKKMPSSGFRFEFYDESVLIYRGDRAFEQPGIDQSYEEEETEYLVIISTLGDEDRFDQIVAELQRIFINFKGDNEFSRFHLGSISQDESPFYRVGQGKLTGYINLAKVN
jgi:hypothetical protein